MQVASAALGPKHQATAFCKEFRAWRLQKVRYATSVLAQELVLEVCDKDLEMVSTFKYLERLLSQEE